MAVAHLSLKPVANPVVLKDRIYEELKAAITSMNVYTDDDEHRLDERQLALEMGVSRTPVREALCRREIATLRELFSSFDEDGAAQARIDEYSETNISFHQALFRLSRCDLLSKITENLFLHMRSIRMRTIAEKDRASRSIIDHMSIIEALEARDTELAERLVRQHTLDLGRHVEVFVDWLE